MTDSTIAGNTAHSDPTGPYSGVGGGIAAGSGGNAGNLAGNAQAPPAVVVNPSAAAQLAAIRDEWLQPLVDRIAELERQAGRLEAERDAAAQLVDAERQRRWRERRCQ